MLSRKNAEERICSFLLLLARRVARDAALPTEIDLPMTRLDMADYLGLTIETVSRTMSNLAGRGVISQSGRHGVSIRKLATMQRLAGNSEMDDDESSTRTYTRQAVWPS